MLPIIAMFIIPEMHSLKLGCGQLPFFISTFGLGRACQILFQYYLCSRALSLHPCRQINITVFHLKCVSSADYQWSSSGYFRFALRIFLSPGIRQDELSHLWLFCLWTTRPSHLPFIEDDLRVIPMDTYELLDSSFGIWT